MSYKVKLEIFEGPLDLLLYFIKKDEINIYDIPISKITDQYLQYLEFMKLLDLNIAGEYLVMAATLMHIKSKLLLPPEEREAEEEEVKDPRQELVEKLLEYQKFKEAAAKLDIMEKGRKDIFKRQAPGDILSKDTQVRYFEANIFDLISAFSKILKEMPKETFHNIVKDEFTVEEKMHDIYHMLVARPKLMFTELFKDAKNKFEIVVTFLSILELIRLKEIKVYQKHMFDEIEIIRNTESMKPGIHSSGAL